MLSRNQILERLLVRPPEGGCAHRDHCDRSPHHPSIRHVTSWPANSRSQNPAVALPGAISLLAFVAPETDRPAGFAIARRAADEAEVISIGTVPACRRRGIARRLVGRLADTLIAAGVRSLFIEVAAGNDAARALYEAAGFTAAGLRPGYYARRGGEAEDAIVMRLAL